MRRFRRGKRGKEKGRGTKRKKGNPTIKRLFRDTYSIKKESRGSKTLVNNGETIYLSRQRRGGKTGEGPNYLVLIHKRMVAQELMKCEGQRHGKGKGSWKG